MENKNNNNNGNGFLLGVIVGVILTLLFTTKRGRAILKEMMEKGIQKFTNLEQLVREAEEDDLDEEFEGEDDFIPSKPIANPEPPLERKAVEKKVEETPDEVKVAKPAAVEKPVKEEDETTEEVREVVEKPKTTPVKRLFRGLRKRN